MKGFAICHVGFENYLEKELQKKFSNIKKNRGSCIFDFDKYEDLIKFCYFSPLIIRAGELLFEKNISPVLKDNSFEINNEIVKLFNENISFKVECERIGEHDFKSNEFERYFGGFIHDKIEEKLKFAPKVDLKTPDLNIYSLIVDEKCVIGIDFIGFDANKRDYKIYNNPHSIKGDLGNIIVSIALENLNSGIILDPFCGDGVISIELGFLLNKRSHNFYRKKDFIFKKLIHLKDIDYKELFKQVDEEEITNISFHINSYDPMMPNVKATQKNSKIAGIDKKLNITKAETDMLEMKFEKNSISRIITVLPSKSKLLPQTKIDNYYNTVFDQADYILKKNGKIVLLADKDNFLEFAKKYKFTVSDKIDLFENNRKIYVLKH